MIGTILSEIVLSELFPNFGGSDPNDCMLTGIEVMGKLEQLYPD
jgi:hypothetical protein